MNSQKVMALKVRQWLPVWDQVDFTGKYKEKPAPFFYVFSISAKKLKSLSGIQRRSTAGNRRRADDIGIQRRHDGARSLEISNFVKFGYPWSEMSEVKRQQANVKNLRKPGWLPTSVVINILKENDSRNGKKVLAADVITIKKVNDDFVSLLLPDKVSTRENHLPPIEVIDGQHRLWAFDDADVPEDFELPVVAFHGLDIGWQAYLFWIINIKPKKINASLAFDMYPLLRQQDWLEQQEGHSIYRETRAQELVELLWARKESPWFNRINMLGESGIGYVSQAAWVRSLMATFVKGSNVSEKSIGGLFGAPYGEEEGLLKWSRIQQAAFLIHIWSLMYEAVSESKYEWAKWMRSQGVRDGGDPAFFSAYSLLNTDQGVRGFLHVLNDICRVNSEEFKLYEWEEDFESEEQIPKAISSLSKQHVSTILKKVIACMASFDWRTSSDPSIASPEDRILKKTYRGSSGYKELRVQVLNTIMKKNDLQQYVKTVIAKVG